VEGFNELIHQRVRLQIMAALHALPPETEVDFGTLRDSLGTTDGNLGAHLRKLEDAGYVAVRKTFVGRRPRTYLALTPQGRLAYEAHVATLKQIFAAKGQI
jgi:DNA-binding MarR family transcriptional regulator